jgi:hypothetical protein
LLFEFIFFSVLSRQHALSLFFFFFYST